jgi:hypothetical protein
MVASTSTTPYDAVPVKVHDHDAVCVHVEADD